MSTTGITGTADKTGTAGPAGTAAPALGVPQGGRSSVRGWALVIVTVLVIVVLGALALPRGGDRPLDPDSAGPSGSRAVAEILRQQGIEVIKVTTAREVRERTAGATPTGLVVVHTGLLGPEQLKVLGDTSARLVLVEPDPGVLDGLGLGVEAAGSEPARVTSPGCRASQAVAAGAVTAGGRLYTISPGSARPADTCYPGRERRSFSYVDGDLGGADGTVFGQGELLTNRHLAEEGNAALVLGTLGRTPRVVWYVPDPFEAGVEQPKGITELAPPWVRFVVLQLAVAAVLAMVWRGRRFGRLVTEPLPVVVRSAETLDGRASLYRQSHARDRAAATLRTATLRRLARRLDLARDTPADTAANLIAAAAGRPPDQVADLLLGPAPATDAALVTLAQDLDRLEDDLRTKDRT